MDVEEIASLRMSMSIKGVKRSSLPTDISFLDCSANCQMPYFFFQNHAASAFITFGKGLPNPTRTRVYRSPLQAQHLTWGKYLSHSSMSSGTRSGSSWVAGDCWGLSNCLSHKETQQNSHPHPSMPLQIPPGSQTMPQRDLLDLAVRECEG